MSHTPGPWKIETDVPTVGHAGIDAFADDDDLIHRVAEVTGGRTWEEHAANIHLVCAAPDLLAACEAALVKFRATPLDKVSVAADMLRDAIAKARGHAAKD